MAQRIWIGVVLLALLALACGQGDGLVESDDGLRLVRGEYEFRFSDKGEFEVELRVFGVNPNTEQRGPFAAVSHMLVATPTARMEGVFRRQLCEKAAVGEASLVQIMAADEAVGSRLEEIGAGQRPCMRLTGRSLHLDELLYRGQVLTMDGHTSGGFQSDPETYVLLETVEEAACG